MFVFEITQSTGAEKLANLDGARDLLLVGERKQKKAMHKTFLRLATSSGFDELIDLVGNRNCQCQCALHN